MLRLSEKALELLRIKLELNSDEHKIIKDDFIINSDSVKINKDIQYEKTILEDILFNFKIINSSFDSIINLLTGTQAITDVGLEEQPTPDAFVMKDRSKPDSEKEGGGLLSTILGLGAFAFSPAIIKFLTEDPEKIGQSLNAAFTWLKEDLPNFFKNDFIPFINKFLETEIIGNITGLDILKSAGIATALYAGKGIILNLLTKALFKTVGFFLKSFLGFLISPAGLAILAAVGFVSALMYGIKKIGEYGDKKRDEEAKEKLEAERAARAAPHVEANNITEEVWNAADINDKQNKSSGRGIVAGKIQKILKSKDAEMFKKLSPDKKWKMVESALTVDEKRSLLGKKKTAADVAAESKSGTDLLDAKVAQMFPDATMVLQDDYKTQLLGTPEQRKAAREALEKQNVKVEADPVIKSAKETELEAKPMPTRNPNAIPVDTSKTVDMSTGGGTPSYEAYGSSDSGDATAEPAAESSSIVSTPASEATNQSEPKPLTFEDFISNFESMGGAVGKKIEEATTEATKPKKMKLPVIQSSASTSSNRTMMVKPGQSWNINDVPDPTPILGSLFSQLFVPGTNSGAISV